MFGRITNLCKRVGRAAKEEGFASAAGVVSDWAIGNAGYYYWRAFRASRKFSFQGRTYSYFCHKFNKTWRNERAVEIPIVLAMMEECEGGDILEVGNVLHNYFPLRHDVLDKYDPADHVIRQDVVDFRPEKRYDLIVSISTLEHVGWDEDPREPEKPLRAVANLKNCLAPGGRLVVTAPLGYNCALDDVLRDRRLPFTRCSYLQRVSRDNRWVETDWDGVAGARFGEPFYSANALMVGVIEKTPDNGTAP